MSNPRNPPIHLPAHPLPANAGNSVGSGWGDYDNDGDQDLFVANDGENNMLFENGGPPAYAFTRIMTGPPVTDGGNSFGCVWGDYDADGDLDLFVANRLDQKNFLYRNNGNANHWLKVRLIGTESNRSGIGAKVRVKATIAGTPRWQSREVTAQTGYNSQNLEQHFGLKDAAVAESLLVEWPSGQVDRFAMLGVDRLIRIVEGEGATGVEGPARGALDLEAMQVGYGPPVSMRLRLPEAASVSIHSILPGGASSRTIWERGPPARTTCRSIRWIEPRAESTSVE